MEFKIGQKAKVIGLESHYAAEIGQEVLISRDYGTVCQVEYPTGTGIVLFSMLKEELELVPLIDWQTINDEWDKTQFEMDMQETFDWFRKQVEKQLEGNVSVQALREQLNQSYELHRKKY